MVASVFRLRARSRKDPDQFLTPGYPYLPLAYIVVISAFLLSAIFYRPLDTLIGVALTRRAYRRTGRSNAISGELPRTFYGSNTECPRKGHGSNTKGSRKGHGITVGVLR